MRNGEERINSITRPNVISTRSFSFDWDPRMECQVYTQEMDSDAREVGQETQTIEFRITPESLSKIKSQKRSRKRSRGLAIRQKR